MEPESTARADMVERQLQARGIRDMRVLEAMRSSPVMSSRRQGSSFGHPVLCFYAGSDFALLHSRPLFFIPLSTRRFTRNLTHPGCTRSR